MSLHSSSIINGKGSTPKDPLYKILDELRSLKLWKEKQERKEKGKNLYYLILNLFLYEKKIFYIYIFYIGFI